MNFLAVAVLLTVLQAAPPVPSKTSDIPASSSSAVKKNPNKKQAISDTALSVQNANSTKTDQQPRDPPSQADEQKPVVILDRTPVSGWTKAYVILTGLLALVGALGVGYAIRTLRAVERQALSMRRQTTHLRNSVVQALKAATAAKRSAEFAELATKASERANILLATAGIFPIGPVTGDSQLKVSYQNFGRTRAKDVSFKIEMRIEDLNLTKGNLELPPMIMGAGQDQTITFQSFRDFLTLPIFKEIVEGKRTLRFVSSAVYQDVFGDRYTTLDIGVFETKGLCFRIEQQIAG